MSLTSIYFFLFMTALIIIYFIVPKKVRWIVLLVGSCYFYLAGGLDIFCIACATVAITYFAAIWMEKASQDIKKKRLLLSAAVVLLLGFLTLTKVSSHYGWQYRWLVVPLGISYYTFSLIGYLADVYWKKEKAETNYLKLLLFTLYFPKIIQGPISKHKSIAGQLLEGHEFDYDNLCAGVQLAMWGYFKKLVIADRAAIFVDTVFGGLDNYLESGAILTMAVILSTVQLYCDFSGYMDIVIGISQILGIQLENNFKRPFFSKSAAEFWRRWHITLGAWFKDYVYMPIVISPRLIKFSTWVRNHFGKRTGKAMMNVIPLAVVWLLTGLWHGTGKNYVLWGIYWGAIIITTTVFAPEIKKFNKFLHINTEASSWQLFQMVRTTAIFCVGRLITAPGSLRNSWKILLGMTHSFRLWELFDGTIYTLGLAEIDMKLLVLSIGILWIVGIQQEKSSIRERISGWNALARWSFYAVAFVSIFMLGIYGTGYDASSFAYERY
ncbi:hypothetical protein C806_01839 [Lachnospiraceae bacterium 3-1]|nr:hypothetical protein C806_01839 [Lachnospiraceae bacterium 3-1]